MAAFAPGSALPLLRPAGKRGTAICTRRPPLAVAQRMVDFSTGEPLHPVLEILKRRLERPVKPGQRNDGRKVALCIEGGGMRGAVSAGMVAAIKYCGLDNAFDAVYGSSAGSIVGAYFVSRQLPVYGAQIYYDTICSIPENGQRFIDLWALRHHPYLRLKSRKSKDFYAKGTRPVLLLDTLIDSVMRTERPLNWESFWKYHTHMPLKPVASSLSTMEARTLDDFSSLDELLECLRASARVPGIAGNPVEINGDFYGDGLLCEPIPYRSAVCDGCTDVLVLRTRPESAPQKTNKPGIYEKHIASPYFDMFPSFAPRAKASDYIKSGSHLSVYNDDLLRLRRENEHPFSFSDSAVFSIVPPRDAPIVRQLESRASVVYEGVRNGFAAAYDALSPFADPCLLGVPNGNMEAINDEGLVIPRMTKGLQAAKWVFSDEELEKVQNRHKKAAGTRANFRRKKRNDSETVRVEARRRRLKQALRRRHRERANMRITPDDEDLAAIEERFFVG